jgi:hypothetical protein
MEDWKISMDSLLQREGMTERKRIAFIGHFEKIAVQPLSDLLRETLLSCEKLRGEKRDGDCTCVHERGSHYRPCR